MGLFSYVLAGCGFMLTGAHEVFVHAKAISISSPNSQNKKNKTKPSPLFFVSLSIFSFCCVINSILSILDAHNSNDAIGIAIQLQVQIIAFIFLFYSILPLLLPLPRALLGLVGASAFVEEFMLFSIQRKDPSGVENRYYDLLLVPIIICIFCALLDLESRRSNIPKLGRGIGLILQGTWFIQMGFSLFSSWVADGCSLHQLSRGNYTLKCKGHPEYHRARAIATLQFNCHLALMVILVVGLFSVLCRKDGIPRDTSRYAPLGAELQHFENSAKFTLDSDDDEDINVTNQKPIAVENVINGNTSLP